MRFSFNHLLLSFVIILSTIIGLQLYYLSTSNSNYLPQEALNNQEVVNNDPVSKFNCPTDSPTANMSPFFYQKFRAGVLKRSTYVHEIEGKIIQTGKRQGILAETNEAYDFLIILDNGTDQYPLPIKDDYADKINIWSEGKPEDPLTLNDLKIDMKINVRIILTFDLNKCNYIVDKIDIMKLD
ncbi:hypothetical protein A2313_00865 [Candidatus Roizmanbacteria bacterium RIFOXYB2_FULL_41_10]|uniref:Uncharacterized protein n=1 Tax=Candidatus Roizmanbacteria bacterium RIFOXYA1_FULL_41_12 TaxID=1802082 RepID=A0A1F7KFA7_9BACT|nr:MAG: hypothetical protein A2262_03680 [Candidatus Roizmanbacteria bacterium RIFOXYA2_FULL_41_8]OGK66546.1 MAG: hypothetical protein A2209_00920 [Candidatus Roizmanbacteria bacterium RIFOXYA1_FULL_41_12]OGK67245.1 MAG: hypothetical protein A2377_01360 [Candidatus Roizmanbacteria bacterium RIFOXYB1_FULL_41_27]OGK69317.1 MAG: hypothetical protein A2313_00865 [Candidatus Roizmanbacteria bacterium RIFOXYB2_FULL_41_10]OGK71775.1 MAG: hypothetical protein A2403_00230 [Candidatus Roizmanbacteria bac